MEDKISLFVVTGVSGAGKSTVLKTLEDLGYFCIDNVPSVLMSSLATFLEQQDGSSSKKLALGIDIRGRYNMVELADLLNDWRIRYGSSLKIMFVNASSAVLLKRFQETRRKHPLAITEDLLEAIEQEKNALQPLIGLADITLDTDHLSIHELRACVRNVILPDARSRMTVTLMSFGFKYGVPRESNFVFDLRALPNPHFVPELRPLPGTNPVIQKYLFEHEGVRAYHRHLVDFLSFSLEKSYEEGRFFVLVAIGCTGGRHRSVAFVEQLRSLPLPFVYFLPKHRDLLREG